MEISEAVVRCPLFTGIAGKDLGALIQCLSAVKRSYGKDEYIFMSGDEVSSVGIVLSGGVRILQEDFWGHRTIFAHIEPGGLFGEALSCMERNTLPVSVAAAAPSEVMLIDYRKIVTTCSSSCVFHTRLVMNMMRVLAEKNILLTRKMEHISKRTTRDKLLSFLSDQAVLTGSDRIEIPFNRQELADFLCVDRSALSRELGAMRAEGLLVYNKNRFELKHV